MLRVETALNPQARYGADVMSRLQYDLRQPGELGRLIREALGRMLGGEPLREVLVAGNTAMHHLFCGLDVEPLTHAPFLSPTLGGYRFADSELGWPGPAEFLPCLGGFVGSDLLCGIVATRLDEQTRPRALFDIGTNGEVVVGSAQGIVCASTAAGPAFEGGRIGAGMRAGAGAIDTVHVRDGGLDCHVIGGGAARGICGSGLVDAAACGVELGLIGANGRLTNADKRLPLADGVALTQGDIRELQLAKGAMAAGLRMLAGGGVEKLCLAGAFGNYIRQAERARHRTAARGSAGGAGRQQLAARRAHVAADALHAPGAVAEDRGAFAACRTRRRPRFPVSVRRDDGACPLPT